jgi:hypothetical protein
LLLLLSFTLVLVVVLFVVAAHVAIIAIITNIDAAIAGAIVVAATSTTTAAIATAAIIRNPVPVDGNHSFAAMYWCKANPAAQPFIPMIKNSNSRAVAVGYVYRVVRKLFFITKSYLCRYIQMLLFPLPDSVLEGAKHLFSHREKRFFAPSETVSGFLGQYYRIGRGLRTTGV